MRALVRPVTLALKAKLEKSIHDRRMTDPELDAMGQKLAPRCEGALRPSQLLQIAVAKCKGCQAYIDEEPVRHTCWRDPLFKASIGLPRDREELGI